MRQIAYTNYADYIRVFEARHLHSSGMNADISWKDGRYMQNYVHGVRNCVSQDTLLQAC
jgi:hypothetical protein